MVSSRAATVEEYLAELPPERADVVRAVRAVILERIPDGFVEAMSWGMITYEIPLARYPTTYNGKALSVLSLAAQKHHFALYLNAVYTSPELDQRLREAYAAAGTTLDMGKSCLRFKDLGGIELDAVADVVGAVAPEAFIAMYEASRRR